MKLEQELIQEAARLVGSQAKLARLTGLAPAFINQMYHGLKPVPDRACVKFESATNGVVSRKRFRPHDYAEIWPELAEQSQTDSTLPTR